MKKVLIIDTSILCVWLQIKGMEACGSDRDKWTYERVSQKINDEKTQETTFILPLATIIETGNHISHSVGDRYKTAQSFVKIINDAISSTSPWAAFTQQSQLWNESGLSELAARWKKTVLSGQSLGDASIVDVANHYANAGFNVEILTGDEGLKSYEPTKQRESEIPRRRKK